MSKFAILFVPCLWLLTADVTPAAEKPAVMVVTVGEMCGGCVKKITAKLQPLPEVADVKCNIAAKTVAVTPSAQGLSPRKLWEAMAAVGKTPKKLVTPEGTFTEKPRN